MRDNIANTSSYKLSELFGSQTITYPVSKWIILPFNKYIEGYEMVIEHNKSGHWAYLNGKVDYRGWWYYFPLVLWYKLTIPVLGLFSLAFLYLVKIRKKFFEEFLILFPPLLFLGISMTSKIDIGIRHIILVLPFCFIFLSRLGKVKNIVFKPLIYLLVLSHILTGIIVFPNYIPYFNQIAGGSANGIRYLADSNLDWNQNIIRFGQYAKEEKINRIYTLCWDLESFQYYGVKSNILPNFPVNGVVVICAQQLVVPPEGFDFNWVLRYPPDKIIGHTLYVWRFDKKSVQ